MHDSHGNPGKPFWRYKSCGAFCPPHTCSGAAPELAPAGPATPARAQQLGAASRGLCRPVRAFPHFRAARERRRHAPQQHPLAQPPLGRQQQRQRRRPAALRAVRADGKRAAAAAASAARPGTRWPRTVAVCGPRRDQRPAGARRLSARRFEALARRVRVCLPRLVEGSAIPGRLPHPLVPCARKQRLADRSAPGAERDR